MLGSEVTRSEISKRIIIFTAKSIGQLSIRILDVPEYQGHVLNIIFLYLKTKMSKYFHVSNLGLGDRL